MGWSGCVPTAVIAAWAQCGHCNKPFTRLASIPQEPCYYTVDLLSGLCCPQPQKVGEGLESPLKVEQSCILATPLWREDIRGEESVLTCDLVTVSTVPLEPAQVPEETASSKPLAALVQKKPALEEGVPSGDRWTGKTIDWGSPRL